jgi:hypothetical protein
MTISSANCPSCGAPISFKLGSSIVVICEYCGSAIARTDRDVKNLGKVAELVDTQSPLEVGKEGRFDGAPFVLTGRAQLRHPAGGVWDEWYATFGNGRTGWLAEAQGKFYMTFPMQLADASVLPAPDTLQPGAVVAFPGATNRFVVQEISEGTPFAAEGEIPYELVPGETYRFVDLSGDNGSFATIDYSEEPPLLFYGREATLQDLNIPGVMDEFAARKRKVAVLKLNCPTCNGPLDLRAPDQSLRVTCPNCNSLLDVSKGKLSYLKTLHEQPKPWIPLGATGKFDNHDLTTIGYMVRSCRVEGIAYYWEEYLLYHPQQGFQWLLHQDGHWVLMTPIGAGEVFDGGTSASYQNKHFKIFQTVVAEVQAVWGEFYWRVEIGECTEATDFVCPPEIVGRERSGREVNWVSGRYLSRDEVGAAFKIKDLPDPKGVFYCQPNPYDGLMRPWWKLLVVAAVLVLVVMFWGSRRTVLTKRYKFDPLESSTATKVVFSDPMTIHANENIKVTLTSPVDNSWLYAEGDLYDEQTGLVQTFSMPVEYYHGVDGGESWSEGGQESSIHLSALPAGEYTLRLEVQWEKWQQPATLYVQLQQGIPRVLHAVLLFVLLSIGPTIVLMRRSGFEKKRWAESTFAQGDDDE